MLKYIKNIKYITLISTSVIFMNLSYGEFHEMKNPPIIFYCENTAENPWGEYNPAICKFPFLNAVLGNLASIDKNANIYPSSLESFEFDIQKNAYMLKLKKDLIFQNGRIVTAQDLEFSIVRYFFAKKANPGSMELINIKGIEKIKYGQSYSPDLVDGVKILDERTVAVTLSKPNPAFLYTLARFGSLVPKEELEEDLLTWKKWPIGSGAYKIISEDKIEKTILLSLVNNKEYPKAPTKIIFEQGRTYEPDLTIKDGIAAKDSKYMQEELLAPMGIRIIEFNYSLDLVKDIHFRKAVSLALSRKEISDATIIRTKEIYEMIPEGYIGRMNIKEEQNIEESAKLLKNIFKKYKDKIFLISYTEDESYLGSEYRRILKEQFAKVGLKIEFRESKSSWSPFSEDFKNSPFRLYSKGSDHFDPILAFVHFKKGSSPLKNISPNDDIINNLIEIAKDAPSRDILNINLKNISNYIYKNIVFIPLFIMPTIAYYNPKKIQSIGNQFGGLIFYMHNIETN